MTAMVVGAALTADHLNPGRAFCPLAEACDAASKSELGSFFGTPTSVLGMVAFGGLFLLTLLPVEWARPLLRPAGFFAAVAGLGFIGYQFYALGAFCPLCLVADGAGFLAGVITLTWPQPPIMRTGARLPGEPLSNAMAWTFAAALVTISPFAWPRDEEPAWVEIEPLSELAFEDEFDMQGETDIAMETAAEPLAVAEPAPNPTGVTILSLPPEEDATLAAPAGVTAIAPPAPALPLEEPPTVVLGAPPETDLGAPPAGLPAPTPEVLAPEVAPEVAPEPASTPAGEAEMPRPPTAAPTPKKATPRVKPAPKSAPKRARKSGPLLVEYLNAYCPHCRKTLKRLEGVLANSDTPVRKRRVYTWASDDYPLWARACAYAQTVGREEQMFQELLKSRGPNEREIYAAAKRAGLDMGAFREAVNRSKPPKRLVRDRSLVQRARIRMLPTIDIGRRRLQGEQSASELREALTVAARQHTAAVQ